MGYERVVKIDHGHETLKSLDVGRFWELFDGHYLTGERFDAMFVDGVAKEINFGHSKLAFFKLDDQTVFLEAVEKDDKMSFMFFRVSACHQDIVKVHKERIEISQDVVHEPLESLGGIVMSKWHS